MAEEMKYKVCRKCVYQCSNGVCFAGLRFLLANQPKTPIPIVDLSGYDPETSPDSPRHGSCCSPPRE